MSSIGGEFMGSGGEVVILTRLAGTREFVANATAEGESIRFLNEQTETVGATMGRTTRRGFLMNQMMFTARRLIYGASLAFIAGGVAAIKWGFDFNSAMQQARVALGPVFASTSDLNKELDYLFNFTKYTPFQFKDVTIAFRQMYGAMHPLGITATQVNQTIKAITDALAFAGRTTPAALNRVSVALQHMAFMGRLTGQTTLQLARDGLPIYAALRKELGLTADQLHNVGQLGIPTSVVMQALNRYIESTPGYANAAYRQATMSLHGLFTTFRDNLSQLMGSIEKGFFGRIQGRLLQMNEWFSHFSAVVRHGSIDDVMRALGGGAAVAIWHQLSIDIGLLFHALGLVIGQLVSSRPLWATLYAGLLLMHGVLMILNPLLGQLHYMLYILIPLFVLWRIQVALAVLAEERMAFWTAINTKATKDLTFVQYLARLGLKGLVYGYILMNRALAFAIARTIALRDVDWGLVAATIVVAATMKAQALWTAIVEAAEWGLVVATAAATMGFEALTAVMLLDPFTWLAMAVILLVTGLVLLYLKWSWFHNLVKSTFEWIVSHWRLLAVVLLGPFGIAVVGIVDHLKDIRKAVSATFGWVWDKMKWLESGFIRLWKHIPGHGLIGSVLGHIPGLASGGHVINPGLAMIGEHGPELLSLPAGASVIPLHQNAPVGDVISAQQGDRQPLIIQVMLDKRVLAEAYAEVQLSKAARA